MDISAKWIPVELTKENFNDIFSIERNFQSTQIKANRHVLTKILVLQNFSAVGLVLVQPVMSKWATFRYEGHFFLKIFIQ